MEIYKSEYWSINFDNTNRVIHPKWNTKSGEMGEDIYLSEMWKYTELVEEYKPLKALINLTEFSFPITPEIQTVIDTEMFPRILAVGVRKVAIILSPDFIAQLSIEQVMEEEKGMEFNTNYFDSEETALKWLME